jgi:hypothetical protein
MTNNNDHHDFVETNVSIHIKKRSHESSMVTVPFTFFFLNFFNDEEPPKVGLFCVLTP